MNSEQVRKECNGDIYKYLVCSDNMLFNKTIKLPESVESK